MRPVGAGRFCGTWAQSNPARSGRRSIGLGRVGDAARPYRNVRRVHALIRKALGDAIEARVIEWNPAAHAKPPKASTANEQARRKRRFLDIEEMRRLVDAYAGHRLEAGFQLSAMNGMRRGEVLGLRWRDVDMDAARLVVEQTLVSPRYVCPSLNRRRRRAGARSTSTR
jgi:integrase